MSIRFGKSSRVFTVAVAVLLSSSCATNDHDLAIAKIDAEEHSAAAVHLERCATEGDERCDYLLAALIFSGDLDGQRDLKEAVERMRRAANAELPDAQADLGKLYESGKGVEKDLAMSVDWYRLAADAGQPEAQANLGLMYGAGRGVDTDPAQAAELYRRAAEQGYGLGQGALGVALFEGNGVSSDKVEGYMWTILAAEQQDWTAMENLNKMASQMTSAQRTSARRQASEFRAEVEGGPRRSRLREIRSQGQNKDRGNRRRQVARPRPQRN